MIVCALVPERPNDDTAARRGWPVAGHGVFSVARRTAPTSQSTWVDGVCAPRVWGTTPARMAMIILITPATPAAAWVWLMFDLIEPSSRGCSGERLRP